MYPQAMDVVPPIKKAMVVYGTQIPAGSAAKYRTTLKQRR